MSEIPPFRRWHDDRGDLSLAIDLLESMPPAVMPYIAAGLCEWTDQVFDTGTILRELKSLGKDRIMALHQSQKKRRSYDRDPDLHRIVNTFYVLPETEQESVAGQFVEFAAILVDYMATCDSFAAEPKPDDLAKMKDLFVANGIEAAQTYLQSLHASYNQILLAEEVLPEPQIVMDASGGIQLKAKSNEPVQ